jgi:cell division protein FtsL
MSVASAQTWIGRPHATPRAVRGVAGALRGRRSARERWWSRRVALAGALALPVMLVLVWIRLQMVHTGYDLSTARQLERKLEQEQRELEIEIATLTSPRRLTERARVRLSMRPPAPGQVVSPP